MNCRGCLWDMSLRFIDICTKIIEKSTSNNRSIMIYSLTWRRWWHVCLFCFKKSVFVQFEDDLNIPLSVYLKSPSTANERNPFINALHMVWDRLQAFCWICLRVINIKLGWIGPIWFPWLPPLFKFSTNKDVNKNHENPSFVDHFPRETMGFHIFLHVDFVG